MNNLTIPLPARRLLIVDDDAAIRATLETYFAMRGYLVDTAGTVPEALAKLRQEGDQVILADIRMPGLGGLDFLRAARARQPSLRVLLMTGYPSLDTLIDAKQHGATAYIRKPLNLADVAVRLCAMFEEGLRVDPDRSADPPAGGPGEDDCP